ncbi:MAG: IS200/IS605 family transposase [Flavobacteriales bacterium]|nr:IS200/IS605 family transposase [Flavobacteriales bacterium]
MAAYLSLHYHIVFATKRRVPVLDKAWRAELHGYMGGTLKGLGTFPQAIDGWNDHVHILVGLKATHVLADVVRELKKAATAWIRDEKHIRQFAWQEGYAACTVGWREREIIRKYIEGQEQHHGHRAYSDELVNLLNEAGIEFDPKYLG